MKKAFDEGWGAVIAKTVSLDSSKVLQTAACLQIHHLLQLHSMPQLPPSQSSDLQTYMSSVLSSFLQSDRVMSKDDDDDRSSM